MHPFLKVCALVILAGAAVAGAQRSAEVERRAAGWFVGGDKHAAARSMAFGYDTEALERLLLATQKAVPSAKKGDLLLVLVRFNPIWTSANALDQTAAATIRNRLAQLSSTAVTRWGALTGLDHLRACLSMAAEDALFPRGTFKPRAVDDLIGRLHQQSGGAAASPRAGRER
jgi:hypothetical protein